MKIVNQSTIRIGRLAVESGGFNSGMPLIEIIMPTIPSLFTNDCMQCKNKDLVWDDPECNGCKHNQLFAGDVNHFRPIYAEYRGKKR